MKWNDYTLFNTFFFLKHGLLKTKWVKIRQRISVKIKAVEQVSALNTQSVQAASQQLEQKTQTQVSGTNETRKKNRGRPPKAFGYIFLFFSCFHGGGRVQTEKCVSNSHAKKKRKKELGCFLCTFKLCFETVLREWFRSAAAFPDFEFRNPSKKKWT